MRNAAPPDDWIETALAITGGFETEGDPFAAVAGDFDGQGVSLGALQWNIGQGTLQPLVRAAGRDTVLAEMPQFGARFWRAATALPAEGLAIVRGWQVAGQLDAGARAELEAFAGSKPMRARQRAAAARIAARAYRDARSWAGARCEAAPGKKAFCWFFDLRTQNGGLRGLGPAQVRDFIACREGSAADTICDWLAARMPPQAGAHDCRRNAKLWRGPLAGEILELLALSYLRCRRCRPAFAGVVLNRKGTIAMARGWVNATFRDMAALFPAEGPGTR